MSEAAATGLAAHQIWGARWGQSSLAPSMPRPFQWQKYTCACIRVTQTHAHTHAESIAGRLGKLPHTVSNHTQSAKLKYFITHRSPPLLPYMYRQNQHDFGKAWMGCFLYWKVTFPPAVLWPAVIAVYPTHEPDVKGGDDGKDCFSFLTKG